MVVQPRASLLKLVRILALAYVVALGGLIDAVFVGRHLAMAGVGGDVFCQTEADKSGPGQHDKTCCLTGCLPQFHGLAVLPAPVTPTAPGGSRLVAETIPDAPVRAAPTRASHQPRAPPFRS